MPNNYYENLSNTQMPTENREINLPNTPSAPLPDEPATPQTEQEIAEENRIEQEKPESSFPDNSTGQLTVSAFTANQLSPVVGATVTVSTGGGDNRTVLDSSVTDRSGKSVTFTLPAPSASASQEPTTLAPFAVYQVSISHPDFYDFIAENVQVFGGIVTQLPVNLIPLPELSNGETTKIVIIPRQNL